MERKRLAVCLPNYRNTVELVQRPGAVEFFPGRYVKYASNTAWRVACCFKRCVRQVFRHFAPGLGCVHIYKHSFAQMVVVERADRETEHSRKERGGSGRHAVATPSDDYGFGPEVLLDGKQVHRANDLHYDCRSGSRGVQAS